MKSPSEAVQEILSRLAPLEERELVPLSQAVGRVLAEAVRSDLDLPPFDKSAMDGFAVHSADFAAAGEGGLELAVVGESRAGAPFPGDVPPGACVEIYTGAEVPRDCDAVVVVERSREHAGGRVVLEDRPRAEQNICKRGQDVALGHVVAEPGACLRCADLAPLASVGCDPVPVWRRPRATVLTTGDELVPPARKPGPGQIRESNTLHLAAMSAAAGCEVLNLGSVGDDPAELERALAAALEETDLVITTGGVSMGRYDHVGGTFERLGVVPVFHKVAIKPGKPLWFGMRGAVPVFALPGNPVSCLVNHAVFVRPAVLRLAGRDPAEAAATRRGRWSGGELAQSDRERHLPVRLAAAEDGVTRLEPVAWNGSADVVGLARAQALAVAPPGAEVRAGQLLAFREIE